MKAGTTAEHEPAYWVAVASAEHVAIGRELGLMQVGHGKGAPLSGIENMEGRIKSIPQASVTRVTSRFSPAPTERSTPRRISMAP